MKTLAAIDIGTNSIKLLVANVEEDGTLDVVLREKAMVRLGSETLRTGLLSPEAIEAGASTVDTADQVSVSGSYRPPEFSRLPLGETWVPPQITMRLPVQTAVCR